MVTIIKSNSKVKDIEKSINKTEPSKKLDAKKFSGILKIDEDALQIQKRLRNEWK
ncbi:hypothetical protein [Pedobacter alpinus]|uniref:Uncharacterized protein n=1 Tax=Pedobacter alpinus TaxID=1590643 RepID=A0ABW5TNX6_9SPHI